MGKTAWALTVGVGALALGVGLYAGFARSPSPDATTLMALSLPDTQGREQPLAQWKGRVIVVNFWATWCEPCREEMPEFVHSQTELGPKGVQFVGIAIDELDKVSQFQKAIELNYPVLMGGYGAIELSKTMGNRLAALPFTVIIDRQGNVAHTQLGRLKPPQLRSILTKLL
jgi:thiol-disulfide isomerase/thioredoxin